MITGILATAIALVGVAVIIAGAWGGVSERSSDNDRKKKEAKKGLFLVPRSHRAS